MYRYEGISTNNLKNISVEFDDNELIYIGGVSGSGKTSLAFDTIAAISENEYGSLVNDNKISIKYKIKDYGNVLVAASLKQLNFNSNPRSIILTYFGLSNHLSNILSQCTLMKPDCFSLNGPCRCRRCNGIGYVDIIDEILIVAPERTLKEGPFKCWNTSYSDFFSQLLHNFCKEKGIDENKYFYELSKKEKELLLRSKGEKRYKIDFVVSGRKRTKTTEYIGPISGMEMGKKDMFGLNQEKYTKQCICPDCKGSRLADLVNRKKVVDDFDVRFMLTQSMDDVAKVIEKIKLKTKLSSVKLSCDIILKFIKACCRLNVSYLNFSRGINTLSGGELQRLRMVHLMLGKLKNLLVVLDEPTGSLDLDEAESLIKIIKELKKNNTIIVVDHNNSLKKAADRVFFLGPKSGINGGLLIPETDYIKTQNVTKVNNVVKKTKKICVPLKSEYVNYSNELIIFENALNGICGLSGIGKSIILKDILPYRLDGYKYITQKPIKANSMSTIATYTGIIDDVKKYFVSKSKKDKKYFSISQKGACPKCKGKGRFVIDNFYDEKLYVDCEACNGTGFAEQTLSYKVNGMNIYDFLNQNIDQIIEKEINVSKKFDKSIQLFKKLGLGHLSLNQKISTLSGGENQRIKLSLSLREGKAKIFGLDEPSKGLCRKEIFELVSVIYENIIKYKKTFIVAEHNREFLELCTYVNSLVRDNGRVKVITGGFDF